MGGKGMFLLLLRKAVRCACLGSTYTKERQLETPRERSPQEIHNPTMKQTKSWYDFEHLMEYEKSDSLCLNARHILS